MSHVVVRVTFCARVSKTTMMAFGRFRPQLVVRTSWALKIATSAQGPRATVFHFWNHFWFRRFLRAARIGFLSVSLYSVGYASGASDMAIDPDGMLRQKATSLLHSIGATDEKGNVRLCDPGCEEFKAVQRVLPRILQAARIQVRRMQAKLQESIKQQEGPATDAQEEELQSLRRAQFQLDTWSDTGFILADVHTPNAFVTPQVPRLIFVHRGIFRVRRRVPLEEAASGSLVYIHRDRWQKAKLVSTDADQASCIITLENSQQMSVDKRELFSLKECRVVENDEQLAMLLSHELAHAVHDHGSDSLSLSASAYQLELLLLTALDPSGMITFLLEIAAGAIARYAILLPESRCDEMEADATGLQICALAGYDPRLASVFLQKMQAMEDFLDSERAPSWASTHPTTEARIEALKHAEEDAVKCYHSHKEWKGWFGRAAH
ncbi:unnamed protein product [Effrenium voratum]|nr:unnamed protein product [Effrenium voratum]